MRQGRSGNRSAEAILVLLSRIVVGHEDSGLLIESEGPARTPAPRPLAAYSPPGLPGLWKYPSRVLFDAQPSIGPRGSPGQLSGLPGVA